MDMANDKRTGNCNRLNSNGMFVGIRGIRGISTSLFALPIYIVASIKFGFNLFTANIVPLHSFDAFKFRSKSVVFGRRQVCTLRGYNSGITAQRTNFTKTIYISILLCSEIFIEIGLMDLEL
jgi:hypothetical protein